MLWLILLILLIVLLVGSVPVWPYSGGWGYSPAGLIAAVLLVLVVLWLLGVVSFNIGGGATAASLVSGTPAP